MHHILNWKHKKHNVPHRPHKPFLLILGTEPCPPIRSPRGGNMSHRLDGD